MYTKYNTLLPIFSQCSTDVKVALFPSYCIASYKKSTFRKICVALNNAHRKIFGLPNRSSASVMYAQLDMCKFEYRKSIIWLYVEIGELTPLFAL